MGSLTENDFLIYCHQSITCFRMSTIFTSEWFPTLQDTPNLDLDITNPCNLNCELCRVSGVRRYTVCAVSDYSVTWHSVGLKCYMAQCLRTRVCNDPCCCARFMLCCSLESLPWESSADPHSLSNCHHQCTRNTMLYKYKYKKRNKYTNTNLYIQIQSSASTNNSCK